MKPHVRRGKAAKKARQNRAVGRAKVQTAGGNLSKKCRPELEHARPCGVIEGHEDECACGCTAYEEYCNG